jgi:hypothetical protein
MKKFLTSVVGIHNKTGEMGKWPGPVIEANSIEEANEWCLKNTQYLFVDSEILSVSTSSSDTDLQLN